jgi:reverse transcriptase-like protein
MRMPPCYAQPNKVLKLNKALYGLRRSPLLWQTKFTTVLKDLGFTEVPQEPCVVIKGGIICFFFVDDIVFAFRKKDRDEVNHILSSLKKIFTMKDLGELKWFLGMHIMRDRSKRRLWLSQLSYIEKVANEFISDLSRCPETPITEEELLPMPAEEEVDDTSRISYQRKVGSILFAAISTRPDIAFAAARLSRFNQRPGQYHHDAADRLIRYLYRTRHFCIQYGHQSTATSFICASDASFADNTIDRKSSQGYVMKLFGGPVAWRANKQDTVTTSSTEAELLALSQTAKEAMYLSRLFRALSLELDEPLSIECDNRQTIRLLVEEVAKLQTKLRHVDIHSHWLRQEVQRGSIQISWQETKKMMADGLTKALNKALFQRFRDMIGLEDQVERLTLIRREDD